MRNSQLTHITKRKMKQQRTPQTNKKISLTSGIIKLLPGQNCLHGNAWWTWFQQKEWLNLLFNLVDIHCPLCNHPVRNTPPPTSYMPFLPSSLVFNSIVTENSEQSPWKRKSESIEFVALLHCSPKKTLSIMSINRAHKVLWASLGVETCFRVCSQNTKPRK